MSLELPPRLDPTNWKMRDWTHAEMLHYRLSERSISESRNRLKAPNDTQKRMLAQLRDNNQLWFGLRKHVNEFDAEFLLHVLKRHTEHRPRSRTEKEWRAQSRKEQKKRKHYLYLWQQCTWWNPKFNHEEMAHRFPIREDEAVFVPAGRSHYFYYANC